MSHGVITKGINIKRFDLSKFDGQGKNGYKILEVTYTSPYGKDWTTKHFDTIMAFCRSMIKGEAFKKEAVEQHSIYIKSIKFQSKGKIYTHTYTNPR